MPQSSIYYAVGRLSVLEKNALDTAKLERLLQAQGAQEARRILSEYSWPDMGSDEDNAQEHMRRACELLKDLSTDDHLVQAFLIGHDVENLKILLKARSLETDPGSLSLCGTIPLEKMRHAINERKYDGFPPTLKAALDGLEKRLAVEVDPMEIDVALDKAHYQWAFSLLSIKQKVALSYFKASADLRNALMALRAMHAGKPYAFLAAMLLPGGEVKVSEWEKAYLKSERIPLLVNRYGAKVYAAAIAAFMDKNKLAAFEKEIDNYLLDFFTPYRRTIGDNERLIGYLLMRSREAAAVRLILAGKENNFPIEAIRERLRELYG